MFKIVCYFRTLYRLLLKLEKVRPIMDTVGKIAKSENACRCNVSWASEATWFKYIVMHKNIRIMYKCSEVELSELSGLFGQSTDTLEGQNTPWSNQQAYLRGLALVRLQCNRSIHRAVWHNYFLRLVRNFRHDRDYTKLKKILKRFYRAYCHSKLSVCPSVRL